MEKRRFGRTGHMSTVAIFGAAALQKQSQDVADLTMEKLIAVGVNHIDVAPSYGFAEERLGPWMLRIRENFFIGCKTMERTKDGAAVELRASLEKLNIESLDLYQLHAITSLDELDQATMANGALEGIIEARQQGLTRHIGITGHGHETPMIFLEALNRFDFDSVLFPVNPLLFDRPDYRHAVNDLVAICMQRDIGIMTIKAISKDPWGEREKFYDTWYEPYSTPEEIQMCVDFALSQMVTGICTAGDVSILPLVLEACERYQPMSAINQEALIQSSHSHETIFNSE